MAPTHPGGRRNTEKRNDKHEHNGPRGSKGSTQTTQTVEEGDHDVYFIIPRTVTVLYGPYMFQGMMDYRPERLQGLQAFLEKLGVTVNLTPCLDHVNLCRIWFLDELVFSCKLTDLVYGGDGELDPLCWQAADNLETFIKKALKGLRKQKKITPDQLKNPFCPCFQVDHGKGKRQSRMSAASTGTTGRSVRSGSGGGAGGRGRHSGCSNCVEEEEEDDKATQQEKISASAYSN